MDPGVMFPDRLLRRMIDVVENARRCPSDEVPPRSLVRDLAELVPGLWCDFVELDWPTRRVLIGQSSDEDDYPPDYDLDGALGIEPDLTWRLMRQHPNCRYLVTAGRMDVVQFSDFVSIRQLHTLEIYQLCFRPTGTEHVMTVPLPAPPGRTRDYVFNRGPGSGFTDTERTMLQLLQPHLYQIYKDATRRRRQPVRLTSRQLDVLRCAALGLSNDQIAAQLVIAPGTVTKHLENIFARLGVTNRTAAIARVFGGDEPMAYPATG